MQMWAGPQRGSLLKIEVRGFRSWGGEGEVSLASLVEPRHSPRDASSCGRPAVHAGSPSPHRPSHSHTRETHRNSGSG